jgi:hypothetical protein
MHDRVPQANDTGRDPLIETPPGWALLEGPTQDNGAWPRIIPHTTTEIVMSSPGRICSEDAATERQGPQNGYPLHNNDSPKAHIQTRAVGQVEVEPGGVQRGRAREPCLRAAGQAPPSPSAR